MVVVLTLSVWLETGARALPTMYVDVGENIDSYSTYDATMRLSDLKKEVRGLLLLSAQSPLSRYG